MHTRGCAVDAALKQCSVGRCSVAGSAMVALLALVCAEASHLVIEYTLSFDLLCALAWFSIGMSLCFLLPDRAWRFGAVFLVINEGHLVELLAHDWLAGGIVSVGDFVGVSLAYLMLPGLAAAAKAHLDMTADRVSDVVRIRLRPLVRRRAVVLAAPGAEPMPRPVAAVWSDELVAPRPVIDPGVERAPPCVAA